MKVNELEDLREKIDSLDGEIVELLEKRYELVKNIGEWKRKAGVSIEDRRREREILERLQAKVKDKKLKSLIVRIYTEIFSWSKGIEREDSH